MPKHSSLWEIGINLTILLNFRAKQTIRLILSGPTSDREREPLWAKNRTYYTVKNNTSP